MGHNLSGHQYRGHDHGHQQRCQAVRNRCAWPSALDVCSAGERDDCTAVNDKGQSISGPLGKPASASRSLDLVRAAAMVVAIHSGPGGGDPSRPEGPPPGPYQLIAWEIEQKWAFNAGGMILGQPIVADWKHLFRCGDGKSSAECGHREMGYELRIPPSTSVMFLEKVYCAWCGR